MIDFSGTMLASCRRADDDAAARQALADIVVAVADEIERDAARQEGAEVLAGGTGQLDRDGVFAQAGVAEALGHLARQHGAGRAVDVADRQLDVDRLCRAPARARASSISLRSSTRRSGDSALAIKDARPRPGSRARKEDRGEIEALRLPVGDHLLLSEQVGSADDLIERLKPRAARTPAPLGDVEEEVDDVLGFALRILRATPGSWVLSPTGQVFQMAFAHRRCTTGRSSRASW